MPMSTRDPKAIALAGTLALVALAGCHDGRVTKVVQAPPVSARCQAEPVGNVTAFLAEPNEIGAFRLAGTLGAFPGPSSNGLSQLVIHDAQGADHVLAYEVPGSALPIQPGGAYTFVIEHVGRFPPASALLISDAKGLLFAGVSDIAVGGMVLTSGIPGFSFALLPSSCESRSHSECLESLRNAPLRVTRGGESVDLFNGESAELGGYRVTCLTAQELVLSNQCADAGMICVSYTLRRIDSVP